MGGAFITVVYRDFLLVLILMLMNLVLLRMIAVGVIVALCSRFGSGVIFAVMTFALYFTVFLIILCVL
jgi:hypothetical protein